MKTDILEALANVTTVLAKREEHLEEAAHCISEVLDEMDSGHISPESYGKLERALTLIVK